jgi:hypothetical protein
VDRRRLVLLSLLDAAAEAKPSPTIMYIMAVAAASFAGM